MNLKHKKAINIAVLTAVVIFASPYLLRAQPANPVVLLETSLGNIKVEIFLDKSPKTATNFIDYVEARHFDGLIFHRVIANFMVQGGGYEPAMKERKTRAAIPNESTNGLENKRGTLAMARTPEPDSATSQFFINVVDNSFLNRSMSSDGYCVFGKVIEGMEVVDKIKVVKTTRVGAQANIPETDIIIKTARLAK